MIRAAEIVREKLAQAPPLLADHDLDLWLVFVRETSLTRDPALELIYPYDVTWQSAFLIPRSGQAIAIVGRYDADNVERLEAYSDVIGYDESIRPALVEALARLQPASLAVNTSQNDPAADGLTSGMRQLLESILSEAGIEAGRMVPAEAFLASLRGRKSSSEVALIRQAIETTEQLYDEVGERIRPGVSERELADYLHGRLRELGLGTAWDWNMNPLVNTGPESQIGHAAPSDLRIEPGHLVHFDFGIRQDGFCSDIQRMWYVLEPGASAPPESALRVWEGVRAALVAGAAALRPGIQGWQVDEIARTTLREHGLPDYKHAFGHHIGRVAHDGATVLGPRWDRYGQTPYGRVEAGNVFAVELGAPVEGRGWVYLEENVLVTEEGIEWLSEPQTELRLIEPS